MGQLTAKLIAQFQSWDSRSKTAFILAVVLLVPLLFVGARGPEDLRLPATIGAMGLIIAMQGVFLWANRGMMADVARAQRFLRDGQFDEAIVLLEKMRAQDRLDMRAMTLLGNAYRQVGQLETSERVLLEAVDNHPNHYFPLYGFGRTLLVQGRYAESIKFIEAALEHGAPSGVHVDAAEAYYYNGQNQHAIEHLNRVDGPHGLEPHRLLMSAHLLRQLGQDYSPLTDDMLVGLPYWQAQATLYEQTPYGEALAAELQTLRIEER